MSSFISFQNIIYPSNELLPTMTVLEDWSFIYIKGLDSQKYLQNQLTIDVNSLDKTHHNLCAHCNFNGKVWTTMRLFHYEKGYAYIQRRSVSKNQLNELKKYSIFSNVEIEELNGVCLIGLSGSRAKSFLLNFFEKIPNKNTPLICENKKTILWFETPLERFLLVLSLSDFLIFKKKINEKIFLNYNQQWLALDIESGFPIIDKENSNRFTPQSINLEKLKAISFKKGCYYGQETIARIFFKNLNTRSLCTLISKGRIFPEIGSFIEIKIENKWFKIGVLLSFVYIKKDKIWIQTVLYKSVKVNDLFRICGFENIFLIKNL